MTNNKKQTYQKTLELWSFPEMENIGKSGVSRNQINK